jgi:hypothetical protein
MTDLREIGGEVSASVAFYNYSNNFNFNNKSGNNYLNNFNFNNNSDKIKILRITVCYCQ